MRSFFFLIVLLIGKGLFAQQFRAFTPIESSNGLSENSVRTINQLPDGRIAIVTQGMVNLYNGTSFQYIHINDEYIYPLSGYLGFHHAYVENEKRLWLKTQGKLMLIDPSTERYEEHPEKVLQSLGVSEPLSDFFMDSDKGLWMVTVSGKLLYRNLGTRKTVTYLPGISSPAKSADPVYDIVVLNGTLYIFYRSGFVTTYNMGTKKVISTQNTLEGQLPNGYQSTLYVVPANHTLYLLRNGVRGIMLTLNQASKKWEKVIETNYWLNSLSAGPTGEIIVSCRKGLWMMDNGLHNIKFSPTLHLVDGRLIDIEVSNLFFDRQGGLWLGTLNKGLLYYHPDRFRFRNIGKSLFPLPENQELYVTAFAEDKAGQLLIGTDKGVYRYSDKMERLTLYSPLFSGVNCSAMLNDHQGNIWMCTDKGLFIISAKGIKNYPIGNLNHILETKDGHFYICTNDNGLIEFDPATDKYHRVDVKKSDQDKISSVQQVVEYDGTLVGIGNGGLFIYDTDNKQLRIIDRQHSAGMLNHNNRAYSCLLADSRGLLWFGTQDGLNVWDGKKKKSLSFHTDEGLVNNTIKSIIEDSQKSIWVSTSNGVSCVRVGNSNGEPHYSFTNFNRYDGVINNEFVQRSAFITGDGTLLLGGIDGFNKTDVRRIFVARNNLDPVFVDLQVFGKLIKPGEVYQGNKILEKSILASQSILLKYDQNFISLGFSALNYVNPSQTYYRYFLDGVDKNWHETAAPDGVGRATYTDLAPGAYLLKVLAADNSGNWGGKMATLKITVLAPWWKTSFMFVLYGITGLGFISQIISWYIKKNRAKQLKIQQQKLDEMKFSFFTNMSHELKTPLTLILTPLEVILKNTGDQLLKKQLNGIYRNAQSLLTLVNQLLNFRRLELNEEALHLNYCDIDELTEALCRPFHELAASKGINFQKTCPSGLWLYLDKDKFAMMLNNLLSNAFKFTPESGSISVKVEEGVMPDGSHQAIAVSVTDTGRGISSNDLSKIFNHFFQADNQADIDTGSGIGLHLVKEYVRLHHGSVEVKSYPGKGSVFTLYIPSDLKPEIADKLKPALDENGKKNAVTILIAEDNEEFRHFLDEQLNKRYHILLASNGKEALDMVLKQLPDLVISDIMMPEMSGLELCDALKKNVTTSHIPLLLLTARSSDESQFEGYQVRADAYITKPFNIDILFIRVRNLLEQQEQRKQLFKKAIVIQPAMVTASSIDEKLIKRALDCVEKNIDNALYSVEEFSSDMNMERSGLYRKLVSIIGQTPSVFIRSVRLKKAAQLLSQRQLSVAEISDRVGFSNAAYFSKCFQEEFNVKPSHYADYALAAVTSPTAK
ncbi:hybrid sensor histidine kinase/response regulator transcription factor [Mucilaginibacter paludis]|uniref:histidine kinase n=1 Tax=Mucilaginibacter paludis DSM 18603 TaxID=714943 RepID=H1Y377_9SPHI|nr:hybrid sensor histidine kinase/response regulator transcription factor [Mucilaginibacter paludis]EHQ28895.1 histidine kinase [Mucilaginibacter paludis DSM 18603]